jgi:hypothetical protein
MLSLMTTSDRPARFEARIWLSDGSTFDSRWMDIEEHARYWLRVAKQNYPQASKVELLDWDHRGISVL